jgi:hypothetical protein
LRDGIPIRLDANFFLAGDGGNELCVAWLIKLLGPVTRSRQSSPCLPANKRKTLAGFLRLVKTPINSILQFYYWFALYGIFFSHLGSYMYRTY